MNERSEGQHILVSVSICGVPKMCVLSAQLCTAPRLTRKFYYSPNDIHNGLFWLFVNYIILPLLLLAFFCSCHLYSIHIRYENYCLCWTFFGITNWCSYWSHTKCSQHIYIHQRSEDEKKWWTFFRLKKTKITQKIKHEKVVRFDHLVYFHCAVVLALSFRSVSFSVVNYSSIAKCFHSFRKLDLYS